MIKLKFNEIFAKNTYANRGMTLESDINITNQYYDINDIAIIYKKPTPIKVVNVEYPRAMIKEAYFNEPSTLDYTGVYRGYYLEFDAKETQSKTSFPLSNIHAHQLEHIRKVLKFNGIAYLVVRFVKLDTTYLLMGDDLIAFIESNDRKSIPVEYFEDHGYIIDVKYAPRLDYIKIIDKILDKRK